MRHCAVDVNQVGRMLTRLRQEAREHREGPAGGGGAEAPLATPAATDAASELASVDGLALLLGTGTDCDSELGSALHMALAIATASRPFCCWSSAVSLKHLLHIPVLFLRR